RIAELVVPENDVERLIPRHLMQRDVDGALYRLIDDDVEPADVRKRAEHRPQVRALEIKRHRMSGKPRLRSSRGRLRRQLRYGVLRCLRKWSRLRAASAYP